MKSIAFVYLMVCSALGLLLNAPLSQAAPNEAPPAVQLAQPEISGSGCPEGTATATLTADQQNLTVIFDNYIARAGGGERTGSAACRMRIPFNVPQGYRVQVVRLDYYGFASLTERSIATFNGSLRFISSPKTETERPYTSLTAQYGKAFVGPLDEPIQMTTLLRGSPFTSPCGGNFTLEATSQLRVRAATPFDDVQIGIDSLDLPQPSLFVLKWQRCSGPEVERTVAERISRLDGR